MRYFSLILRGSIIWLVPFIASIFFYTPDGQLTTSYALFKSVMVIVLTWTTLTVNLLRPIPVVSPLIPAITYFAINILLDIIVVLPLTGLSIAQYSEQIGLIYLIIPSITYMMLRRVEFKPYSLQQ